MNKVICDICGTSYPDTAESCPICGYSRIFGDDIPEEPFGVSSDGRMQDGFVQYKPVKTGKSIFEYDEEDETTEPETVYYDSEDEEPEEPQEPAPNYFVVIVLVVLITLLAVASGFLFFRYFMPNMFKESEAPTAPAEIVEETITTEETEPTSSAIPCERIALTGGMQKLNKEGQLWLLHVKVTPEDTTDSIVYSSSDETIATVSDNGRVTAVSEGEAVITIRCGSQSITCPVVVDYSVPDETQPEGTIPPLKLAESEENPAEETTAETESEEQEDEVTQETGAGESTEETEAPEETEPKEVTLKLKQFDISFGRAGVSHTLELDCDLKPEEVTWFTNNPNVALVRDGVVTALGPGTTKVFAKYENQQVECIVRCNF